MMQYQTNMASSAKRRRSEKETERLCNEKVTSIYFIGDCESVPIVASKEGKLETPKDQPAPISMDSSRKLSLVTSSSKLGRSFYDTPTKELAQKLLGKLLYRVHDNGEVLCGRIVETEGYLGEIDKACHSYGGKRTKRSEPMYMAPGTAYVYFIYGMYYCLNISSRESGACVLIRALEPVKGLDTMKKFRSKRRKDGGSKLKDFQLCNGPSKLCEAFCIEKANLNKEDMVSSKRFWLEDDQDRETKDISVVTSTRIGIDSYGPEWALKPLRFYVLGNKCVSMRDKNAEVFFKQ